MTNFLSKQMKFLLVLLVADIHSKILDAHPFPSLSNFLHFHAVFGNFGQIIVWRPPPFGLVPPMGNPGSAAICPIKLL